MLNYYYYLGNIGYIGYEIFKHLTNLAKYTGLIAYNDFHIFTIDENIAVSSLPKSSHESIIKKFDVVIGFLGENEYGRSELDWIANTSIKYYNIPVTDYTPPNNEDYLKLFRILDAHPDSKILIHCYAGKGRSNCGVAAYLMNKNRLTASDAIKIVESKNPRSSMNRWQKASLFELERIL